MQNLSYTHKISKIDKKINTLIEQKKENDKIISWIIWLSLLFILIFIYVAWYNAGIIKWTQIKENNVLFFVK